MSEKFSMSNSKLSEVSLLEIYNGLPGVDKYSDLAILFKIANKDRTLFPEMSKVSNENEYLIKWTGKYIEADDNPPSTHIAEPKGPCNDPAISLIVGWSGQMDIETMREAEKSHSLFMSAENIQGELLEEYISIHVRKFGFLWCKGTVFHAIDFCSDNGKCLIQIKNKNNTENSSSSKIRNGTSIIHWFRLSTSRKNGKKKPVFHWDELNKIVNENKTKHMDEECNLNEEDYESFIKKVASSNKDIITPY